MYVMCQEGLEIVQYLEDEARAFSWFSDEIESEDPNHWMVAVARALTTAAENLKAALAPCECGGW